MNAQPSVQVWRAAVVGVVLVVAVGCSGSGGDRDSDEPPWGGGFSVGPHPVGFRTTTLTRRGSAGPRELVLSLWFPASEAAESERLRIEDYFRLVLSEGQLTEAVGLAEPAAFAAATTGVASALPEQRARSGLEAPALAWADPPASEGSYPLVLWSSRHATVLAQAPLSEVLASHGFVVATVLCPGVLETRHYAALGTPALAYGPGLLSVSHGPDEFVAIRKLLDCAEVYALTAAQLLA